MRNICLVLVLTLSVSAANAAGDKAAMAKNIPHWSFSGIFGTFDRNALRRGYQVYKEVCAACHAMKQISFRNLGDEGGPHFTPAQVKAIAAEFEVEDGPDEAGDMFTRTALPRDKFPSPFPNEKAARASNGGAYPPDLSLITKARAGGADYIYSLLVGYVEAPATMEMDEGMSYNRYYSGNAIAMTPPLSDGLVEYGDGTKASVKQMASDVVTFFAWAAEPEMEARKRLGFMVIIYLTLLAGLFYLSMKRMWRNKPD